MGEQKEREAYYEELAVRENYYATLEEKEKLGWAEMHKSNLDQIRERARESPFLHYALQLVHHKQATMEQAMTAVALALDEGREKMLKENVRLMETQANPPMFPIHVPPKRRT